MENLLERRAALMRECDPFQGKRRAGKIHIYNRFTPVFHAYGVKGTAMLHGQTKYEAYGPVSQAFIVFVAGWA